MVLRRGSTWRIKKPEVVFGFEKDVVLHQTGGLGQKCLLVDTADFPLASWQEHVAHHKSG
jgi:hypothetical protein